MDASNAQAGIRFGFGLTRNQRPDADPAAALLRQLAAPQPGPDGPDVAAGFAALAQDRDERRADGGPAPDHARTLFRAEVSALLAQRITTATPFPERLVAFWANHFTVSTRRGEVAPLAGAFVRDAIRPHVTGRFADMLLAAMRHPAMLIYLDNAQSAGPNSRAGQRDRRGLNENLARECLELHTVSPAAGYTQADVTALARVLTGWSIERREEPVGFRFRPNLHEPGAKLLLGREIPDGQAGGTAALLMLAGHPATHRFLATKLVRHFVADQPPADAVRRIEGVLRDTGGDLGAASAALVRLPAAWQPLTKLRTPHDMIVAALRAAALPPGAPVNPAGLMAGLGQAPFTAPLPNGWADDAASWAGPEAMMRRVDWAYGFAGRNDLPEPGTLAEAALGPLIAPATAEAVRRAGSRREAVTLLIASPEFQRR